MMTVNALPETAPDVLPATSRNLGPWTVERLAAIDGVLAVMMYTPSRGYEHAGATEEWRSVLLAAEEFATRIGLRDADVQMVVNDAQRVRVAKQGRDVIVIVHTSNCKATKSMPRTLQRVFADVARQRLGAEGLDMVRNKVVADAAVARDLGSIRR